MKEECVSGILFFSLFTLVVCSDLKAMDEAVTTVMAAKTLRGAWRKANTKRKEQLTKEFEERIAETEKQRDGVANVLLDSLTEAEAEEKQLQVLLKVAGENKNGIRRRFDRKTAEEKQAIDQLSQISTEKEDLQRELNNTDDKERDTGEKLSKVEKNREDIAKKIETLVSQDDTVGRPRGRGSRTLTFVYGTGIIMGADHLLSHFGETDETGKNKRLKLLHHAVQDTRDLQMLSGIFAVCGGKWHQTLNGNSDGIISLENGMPIAIKKVFLETINACVLRYCWKRLISDRVKKINANCIVKFARTLPEPIKKVGVIVARSFVIRKLCDFEKSKFRSLKTSD